MFAEPVRLIVLAISKRQFPSLPDPVYAIEEPGKYRTPCTVTIEEPVTVLPARPVPKVGS
jgi:hypothetical protein